MFVQGPKTKEIVVNLDATVEGGRRKALAFLERYYGVGGVSEEKAANWIASGPPDAVAEQISEHPVEFRMTFPTSAKVEEPGGLPRMVLSESDCARIQERHE